MNTEVKAQWLMALRSGRYKQGKKSLRTPANEFCCLGVLCDVHRISTGEGKWREDGKYELPVTGSWGTQLLPVDVAVWAGLADVDPFIPSKIKPGNGRTLAARNDNGASFVQIADLIETRL